MPKNKGKYRSRAPKDPAPVEELASFTSRAIEAVRPHAVKIGAVAGGVAVVLCTFGVWSWYDKRRETTATEQFGKALEVLDARILAADEPPEPAPPGKPAPPTFPSRRERTEAALKQLGSMSGGADVAKNASLMRAGLLYDLGRYDEAIAEYRRFLDAGADGDLKYLAREGIGYALEAKALAQQDQAARNAGLDEALKTFEQLQTDDKGFYRDAALYHQARLRALKGEKEQAVQLYKKVLEISPATPLRGEINNRLALLEP